MKQMHYWPFQNINERFCPLKAKDADIANEMSKGVGKLPCLHSINRAVWNGHFNILVFILLPPAGCFLFR